MEREEELLLQNLGWKGKGLIKSACDAENDGHLYIKDPDGKSNLFLCLSLNKCQDITCKNASRVQFLMFVFVCDDELLTC